MKSIFLSEKEYFFRCNMYVVSKLLQKKKLNSPDQMLSNLGHLELIEIFYESVKAGEKKNNKSFRMTLDDFGMELSDDLAAFEECFNEFQLSIERYTKAMGVDEKKDEGETV